MPPLVDAPPRSRREQARTFIPLLLLAVVLVAIVARAGLGPAPGLTGEYVDTTGGSPTPVVSATDAEQSTRQIERRWPGLTPATFRVRWFGYLGIDRDDTYTFSITADDGAALSIDGAVVADTGSGRGTFTQAGTVHLAPGTHAVVIDYRQSGGDYEFGWSWARGTGPLDDVPPWRLTTRRGAWPLQRALHAGGFVLWFAGLALAGWVAVAERRRVSAAARRWPHAALLLLFVAMAIVQTWPLASAPGYLSRNDNADTVLNEWALAWVAHQAVRHPLHLFDANIFYPERLTLAYSESMLVQAAMAAPLLWLGASPVLAYNLVLMAGFALNGWVMAFIIRRWTGDTVAGIAAGILFAYNAHIFTRLPHMQALHVEFLPLALFAWDRLLRVPRVRNAVFFGASVALQSLTSVYLLVFTFSAVSAAVLARFPEWIGARFRRIAPLVGLAALVAGAITLPYLLPYIWLNRTQGFERSIDDAASLAATVGSYLASPSRLHYTLWSYRWFGNPSALFPGVTAVVLAALAFLRGTAVRDARARMCLVVTVSGVLLSFGPKVPGYALLFTFVPIYRVVRVVSSFGYIALLGIAMVAGFGVTELRRITPRRAWPYVAGLVLACATLEPMAAPLELSPYAGIPRIYDQLRNDGTAVVVELPFFMTAAGFAQARYMLNSTRHWRPMLNGYSGYRPPSYYENGEALASFPSPSSIAWLQQRGVTRVFVHMASYDEQMPSRLADVRELHEIASDRGIALYRLDPRR